MNLLELATPLLFWAWIAVTTLFAVLWLFQLRTRNATSVDLAWAAAIGALGVLAAVIATGSGPQRLLAATLAGLWSARLSWYLLAHRVMTESAEDGRYQALRRLLGKREAIGFFFVYQLQALLALGFATPFILLAYSSEPAVVPLQYAGIALAVCSQVLVSTADQQLAKHRANPALRGRTCRGGLWRYSRHPNYFFEWLTWCGFGLAQFAAVGWAAAIAPVAMLLSIRFFTGVPFTEKRALVSRGDDYRRYMAETNVFFPGPPRRATATHPTES
ncbi:MAG: steroid 5-alpha reductase family enzyme [Planctomycetota bacterium]|jgi:steroid 5-alpha reductase family enzyme